MSTWKERVFESLQMGLQKMLVRVPKLSEGRLATAKTMHFLRAWHYLDRALIAGDYLEFGVYRGLSFTLSMDAYNRTKTQNFQRRFMAFDSFSGLPSPDPQKDQGQVFRQGDYSAPRKVFEKRIERYRSRHTIEVVPGYYDQTLDRQLASRLNIESAAFVNIDCDLYDSTLAALKFVTPYLATGTILYFDDWYFSGGNMSLGEPKACREWLHENKDIELEPFADVAIMGKMFLVQRKQ